MTIDTNIIIAYLGGEEPVIETLSHWREGGIPLFLPTIVETEVLSFPDWTTAEQCRTEEFLEENFASLPFDRGIARLAATIRRVSRLPFPDAAIAATALFTHTPVVTRNVRDFKRVDTLRIIEI